MLEGHILPSVLLPLHSDRWLLAGGGGITQQRCTTPSGMHSPVSNMDFEHEGKILPLSDQHFVCSLEASLPKHTSLSFH